MEKMKLSDQALYSIMFVLQNAITNESSAVPMLKDLDFGLSENDGLFVLNPPVVVAPENDEDEEQ